MSHALPTERMKFSDLEVGTRFYDALSQEFFVKSSDTHAVMVTWLADGRTPDEFEPDDPVRV
ncbi:hypothetical protein [Zoogloea sp. LCSB751]|uniref:hypothetical protein n=1 Tax=Zoogloea sp. LCSB751 TaxID=1965277 RepID=UPI0009A4C111|nr:hypothetical protein [Zoogloea sp. LCSB751]